MEKSCLPFLFVNSMIIDTSQGKNIEVIGDIKEFKTSIDPKNLEFITTLLSSNLYSSPEQSFIREIVSNAWDSHVEAGTTNVPVIIQFGGNRYNRTITIRDYGTGLSPERFKEVYCNIGSSTKRDSNEFIGGFGIGKYSSLACSNTVYITSYYNGLAYYYIMIKSGNSITTNLTNTIPTSERNGVEVTIRNIYDLEPYQKALDFIVFFPNVFVNGIESNNNIAKIKKFTNFAAASIRIDNKLLLGNVLYPCNKSYFSYPARDFLSNIKYTGIVVKFDVGEVNITPNRESIIYTKDTIKKIEERILAARDELESMAWKKIDSDYSNLESYYNAVTTNINYDPITDSLVERWNIGYRIDSDRIANSPVTYNGLNLAPYLSELRMLYGLTLPKLKGVVDDNKIYTGKIPTKCNNTKILRYNKVLICNAGARLINPIKVFLRENYDGYAILSDFNLVEFATYVGENIPELRPHGKILYRKEILEGAYNALREKAVEVDFDTDTNYLKRKEELKVAKIPNTVELKEAILYVWDDRVWREKHSFKKFSEAVAFIRKLKKGVILTNMDSNEDYWSQIARVKGFVYMKARKDVVEELRKLNLSCIVDMAWCIKEDPKLGIISSALEVFPDNIDSDLYKEMSWTLNKDERDTFDTIIQTLTLAYNNYYYKNVARESGLKDAYTLEMSRRLKHYLDEWKKARAIVQDTSIQGRQLTAAVVMKTSGYKISGKAYKKVKENQLIRILCKK